MKNIYRPITINGKLYIPDWCYEDTQIDYDYKDENHYVRIIDKPDLIYFTEKPEFRYPQQFDFTC